MANETSGGGADRAAEAARRTLIDAALRAHEDAGVSGLCAEGRWEAAIGALRTADLGASARAGGADAADQNDETVREFTARVASPVPAPGGGSVAGVAGMLAAALAQMVAGLTVGRARYSAVDAEMRDVESRAASVGAELATLAARDAAAYADVAAAYRLPTGPEPAAGRRAAAIERALLHATEVPLAIARAAAEAAELGAAGAERGNVNAVGDAAVAALLAEAACRGAGYAVRVNVAALRGARGAGHETRLADEASALATRAGLAAARAAAAVERACAR